MFLEFYIFVAVLTGLLYTGLIYREHSLHKDLKRLGVSKRHMALQYVVSGVLILAVFIMTTLLAPMVWVDSVTGNLIPKEEKK